MTKPSDASDGLTVITVTLPHSLPPIRSSRLGNTAAGSESRSVDFGWPVRRERDGGGRALWSASKRKGFRHRAIICDPSMSHNNKPNWLQRRGNGSKWKKGLFPYFFVGHKNDFTVRGNDRIALCEDEDVIPLTLILAFFNRQLASSFRKRMWWDTAVGQSANQSLNFILLRLFRNEKRCSRKKSNFFSHMQTPIRSKETMRGPNITCKNENIDHCILVPLMVWRSSILHWQDLITNPRVCKDHSMIGHNRVGRVNQ